MQKTLRLGVQTNAGDTYNRAAWLIERWTPKGYRVTGATLQHTDYHGLPASTDTGNAIIEVTYTKGKAKC